MKRYIKSTIQSIFDLDLADRIETAANPTTSPEILQALAKDKEYGVRQVVAHNPNTSEVTLRELSKDGTADVRYGVAYNKNTPKDILLRLSGDPDWFTRNQALKALAEYADREV
jgi:HEAT repeat protein